MRTKTAVFLFLFLPIIHEWLKLKQILRKAVSKPIVWKCYIDYVFSLWDMSKPDIATSIEQANLHHPTIKLTAEISATETMLLDTIVYKGTRCKDQKTHVNI